MHLRIRHFTALAAIVLWLVPAPVLAAGTPPKAPSQGIGISPFLQELTILPSDQQETFTLTLTNHTKDVQELNLQTRDFGSLNDTGGIILEGSNVYSQKFGLASWLSLEKDSVVLNGGQSASLLVTVNNRQDLQPGGHYGAIVATVAAPPAGSQRVQLQQQLISLVLADKSGGEHYDIALKGIEQNGNWLHLPNTIRLHFQNPGNVHVIPRGLVKLLAPNGTVLAQGMINSESAYILPQTFRDLSIPLTSLHRTVPWPGVYHVEVDYRYEGLHTYATKKVAVRFIALPFYLLILVILVSAVLLVRRRRHHRS